MRLIDVVKNIILITLNILIFLVAFIPYLIYDYFRILLEDIEMDKWEKELRLKEEQSYETLAL